MFLGLRPLELVWLGVALTIIGQQIIERDGVFDPVAFATAAFFIGLIPAGRGDKKSQQDSSGDTPISQLAKKLMEKSSSSTSGKDKTER